ncbi:hypothetical protein GRI44_03000 [Altererythrobacter confluentis]|uniref:Uncharacterized protein n=1 Tax=Allopontixanthobacter confluentis TaxID=1849021 RepID=A0A6L7GCD9_9SPHN|nr:hypothetical protein [Allopontixanthobacter confluentis]MXP13722.1 hypothetical protein [Allopontixanthobacter confluentis]
MSRPYSRETIARHGAVLEAPRLRTRVDRTFELPTGLYVATVGCYLAFLATLASAFAAPGLIIPLAICALIVVAIFGVPSAWARMAPASVKRPMAFNQFESRGIATLTGHLSAGEATVQVLVLPVLIVLWGLAVVTIAALV